MTLQFKVWDVEKARESGPFSYGAAISQADEMEALHKRAFLVLPHEHVHAISLRGATSNGAALY